MAFHAPRAIAVDQHSVLVRVAGKRHPPIVVDDAYAFNLVVMGNALNGFIETLMVVGHHRPVGVVSNEVADLNRLLQRNLFQSCR